MSFHIKKVLRVSTTNSPLNLPLSFLLTTYLILESEVVKNVGIKSRHLFVNKSYRFGRLRDIQKEIK